jgi:hypothetical protein
VRVFWNLLKRDREPTYHTHVLEKEVRREVLGALWHEGILVRADPANDWYPCSGPVGDGCPMRVVPASLGNSRALIAMCGQEEPQCIDVCIDASALEMVTVSIPGLLALLRRVFSIELGALQAPSLFPGIHHIGTCRSSRQPTEVYLACHPHDVMFPAFLLNRRSANVPSLVLASTGTRLSADLAQQYSIVGDRVELRFLDQLLVLRDNKIVLATETSSMNADLVAAPFSCGLYDHSGSRLIDQKQRLAIVSGEDARDLVVDLTTPVARGYAVYLRTKQGRVRKRLARDRTAVIAELIVAGRALEAREFKSVSKSMSVDGVVRLIQNARKDLEDDVKSGRYEWQAFHTHAGTGDEPTKYEFRPPPGYRFAVLRPLP